MKNLQIAFIVILSVILFKVIGTISKNNIEKPVNIESIVCGGNFKYLKEYFNSSENQREDILDMPLLLVAVEPACNKNVDIVNFLISKGYDVNTIDIGYAEGTPALITAIHSCPANIIASLLNAGANVDVMTKKRGTALIELAATYQIGLDRDKKIAKLLISKGADPEKKGPIGKSAHDYAVEYKNLELQEIIEKSKGK